ncbi:PAS domain S-box protein [bacterium]|nr:PAS domain S-box protein [bacterium]NIO18868.1 PAS domain S-box protein [bacterium]
MKKTDTKSELAKTYGILIKNMGEGLCVLDKNFAPTFVNPKFCEIIGYSRDEILGKSAFQFVKGKSREILKKELEKRAKGESSRYTVKVRKKNGEEAFLLISGVSRFDKKGKFAGTIAIVSDITERKRLEKELEERTMELEKEVKKRTQLLVDLYRGVAVSEERSRLAQEIHDSLAQTLATSLCKTEMCEKLLGDNQLEARRELSELRKMLGRSVSSTRHVIFGLQFPNFHRAGFIAVLKQYFQEFERKSGISCDLKVKLERSLAVRTQVGIYQIIREAMNNVRKHATAKRVDLELRTDRDGNLHLIIEDNGKGFCLKKILARSKSAKRFGLKGMRERAKRLGGSFAVETARGQGTRIKVKVPLKKKEK